MRERSSARHHLRNTSVYLTSCQIKVLFAIDGPYIGALAAFNNEIGAAADTTSDVLLAELCELGRERHDFSRKKDGQRKSRTGGNARSLYMEMRLFKVGPPFVISANRRRAISKAVCSEPLECGTPALADMIRFERMTYTNTEKSKEEILLFRFS